MVEFSEVSAVPEESSIHRAGGDETKGNCTRVGQRPPSDVHLPRQTVVVGCAIVAIAVPPYTPYKFTITFGSPRIRNRGPPGGPEETRVRDIPHREVKRIKRTVKNYPR